MDSSSIDYAEGRVFSFDDVSAIRPDILLTLDCSGSRQTMSYQMNVFTEFCPFLGLQDTGIVWIGYIPQNKLGELKPLIYYLISFCNFVIYQEDVKSMIFNDLNRLLEPEELLIKTRYITHGETDITCTINSNEQKT